MADIQVETLSQVIHSLYGAAHGAGSWASVVEKLRVAFGGSKACLCRLGPHLRMDDTVATASDQRFVRMIVEDNGSLYRDHAGAVLQSPVGTIYNDVALLGPERLRASRFFNEWMAPQDMYGGIGCRLVADGASSWFVDVQRGARQEPFAAGEASALALLVPHLMQAWRIALRVRAGTAVVDSLDHLAFGLLIVDSRLRILTCNEAAEAILEDAASPLRRRGGRLSPAAKGDLGAALGRLVADVCDPLGGDLPGSGGDLVLGAQGEGAGDAGLSVSVSPLGGAQDALPGGERLAAIAVRRIAAAPSPGFEAQLRRAYGLSPKEARLASGLAAGASLAELAERETIAISTARSYLESVFFKTGARRQGQLVALLKQTEPLHRR